VIVGINQAVNAQSDNFKNYTNKDLGFSIQHPSKWKPEQSDLGGEDSMGGVDFEIRKNPEDKMHFGDFSITPRSYFRVDVHNIEPELDYNTMTLQNKTLEQYAQAWVDVMPKNSQTLIRQSITPVGGNEGIKIEYKDNKHGDYYGFDILSLAKGKLYTLSYGEKPLKVPETLPLVNKMVDSFQVNTGDQDLSNKAKEDMTNSSNFHDKNNNSAFDNSQNKNCPPMSLVLCENPNTRE